MKCVKLNKNWNAEPNAPNPTISEIDNGIELSFLLNPFEFEHIDNGEVGKLEFNNVYAYRLGSTNCEGYFHGQFRYKNEQLPWGEFYELFDSKWEQDFPNDKIIVQESINKKQLCHFIFFFRDNTFECLATEFKFTYNNNVIEILDEKYPKGYLNHYITMFASQFNTPSVDNFKIYTDLYIQMEGKKEFEDLKQELKDIIKNNDLHIYLKYANNYEFVDFKMKQLTDMIKVIQNYR